MAWVGLLACGNRHQQTTTGPDGSAPQTLIDPVKSSQADPTLPGTDANGNGVRDDLDAYISTLETHQNKRTALTAFSRECTQMMILGAAAATTQADAYAQQIRVVKTVDCLASFYGRDRRRALVDDLGNALYNNESRLRAYHRADALLTGTILPSPGTGCDPSITGLGP